MVPRGKNIASAISRGCFAMVKQALNMWTLSLLRAEPGAQVTISGSYGPSKGFQTTFKPPFGTDSEQCLLTSIEAAMAICSLTYCFLSSVPCKLQHFRSFHVSSACYLQHLRFLSIAISIVLRYPRKGLQHFRAKLVESSAECPFFPFFFDIRYYLTCFNLVTFSFWYHIFSPCMHVF